LQQGLKQDVFGAGKVTGEQLADLVNQLEDPIKDPQKGSINYDRWLLKYVGDYFVIHNAFMGLEHPKGMPRWDAVIASFEMLDKCSMTGRSPESDHLLPWDHFRKALKMAGIQLDDQKVQKLIDKIDIDLTGYVRWTYMVEKPVAPYFLDGKADYDMRQLMLQGWPELYEICKSREQRVRRTEKGLLPQQTGVLPLAYLEECLYDTPILNLSRDDPKCKPMIKKITEVCNIAFVKMDEKIPVKDRNDRQVIDYEAICKHYAGASFDAEKEFEKKWEVIIEGEY